MLGREDVVAKVLLVPSAPAGSHTRLRCEMKDQITLADHILERPAREVDRGELERIPTGQVPKVAQLLTASVVVVEAIDADNFDPIVQQRLCEMRADETRASRDKDTTPRKARISGVRHQFTPSVCAMIDHVRAIQVRDVTPTSPVEAMPSASCPHWLRA